MGDPWAKAAAEFDEENRQRENEFQKTKTASEDWRAKWPKACRACLGWGGASHYDNHGLPGPSEQVFDPCDRNDPGVCHRCGDPGLNEDDDGPCSKCGWNYDDGDPGAFL